MEIKLVMLIIFFAVMVGVGIYARRHATSVDGFVLGGRAVGPWLTAFPMPIHVLAIPYFQPNCPAYPTNTTAEK